MYWKIKKIKKIYSSNNNYLVVINKKNNDYQHIYEDHNLATLF